MANAKRYYIFCILLLLSSGVLSMSDFRKNKGIVEFGTKEFDHWLSDKQVAPLEAWKTHKNILREKLGKSYAYKLWICVGDEYLFSSNGINKLRMVSLGGIYVNAYTGEYRVLESEDVYTLKEIYATPVFGFNPSSVVE